VQGWEASVSRVTRERLATREVRTAVAKSGEDGGSALSTFSSPYLERLLTVSKALGSTSTSQTPLSTWRVRTLIHQSGILGANEVFSSNEAPPRKHRLESEAEWLVVSMATVQCYGVLLQTLLNQSMPLNDEIWYWDGVLSSYTNLALYTLQTSPARAWEGVKNVKEALFDARVRLRQLRSAPSDVLQEGRQGLSQQWRDFYDIVRQSVAERSLQNIQARFLSPVARCRADALSRRHGLEQLRLRLSSSLGILIDEGLRFGPTETAGAEVDTDKSWMGMLERSVSLMQQVTKNVILPYANVSAFEDVVFETVEEDDLLTAAGHDEERLPRMIALRLDEILKTALPAYSEEFSGAVSEYGRPSKLVRYWLPAGVLVLCSSTILRIIVHRQGDIIRWIKDAGTTTRDFWFNWVVEPVGRVIRTIRHDANSEIALMSRDSLKADRDSLERMVVDFARDKPQAAMGVSNVSDAQLADIRAKVREGDVTPVLRAYENDLRKPFVGAIKGDLVRSLLIQVQKTKVDLEVAIGGIDALLKSQELVFGFVGLTPGILVSIGVFQYLRGALGSRHGLREGQRAGRITRVLRNMDRIFYEAAADPASINGILSYKYRGMLVCEAHVLRSLVKGIFPGHIEKEFLEDLEDVMNSQPVDRQRRALKRIRWAYAKWLK
jgi:nuclear control of ATPase protein 2